jgi:hypothetical protein
MQYSVSGSNVYYAGGGSSGDYEVPGGGGKQTRKDGRANTGGGGAGCINSGTAGNGGSGIVIVKYIYSSSLSVSVTAPTAGQQFLPGSSVTATVSVAHGTAPYSVEFYTNGVSAWSTNSSLTNLFTIPLGTFADGTHTNYATVTDNVSSNATSATNTFTVGPDTTAPTPNPMGFAAAPAALSATSIVMTASTATDVYVLSPPVQYFFENVSNLVDSGWISSTVWTNTSLTLGTTYGYRVKARDSATPTPNETGWSAVATAAPNNNNTATNSGNWGTAGTWSRGVPSSVHDVIIPTGITVTNTGLDVISINSLSITGTLTHAANVSTEVNKLNLNVAGSVTVASNGVINVNGKGYGWNGTTTGYGPGGGVGLGCASHGGQSGGGNLVTYGSVTNPVNLGSGCAGRSDGAKGSAGGGAVLLQVGGTLTVEATGSITADGDGVTDRSAGSGGSVNITAASFAGSGTISAIGGTGGANYRQAAGGGRIALVAGSGTPTQFGTLTINARGGDGSVGGDGGAGTIFLKAPTQTYGSLVIKNVGEYTPALTTWTNETWRFDSITTLNYGTLAVGTNSVLDLTGTTLVSDSTPASITSRIKVDSTTTNRYVFPAAFTMGGCLSQGGTNLFPFPGDVIVSTNGVLTHEGGLFSTTTEANRLNLSVAGNVTVQAGGAISVKGRGYGASGYYGYGPGGGYGRSGASHGGQGASSDYTANTVTYGSIINPVNYGSGGGGRDGVNQSIGGGAIVLQVGGTMTVNGLITADGNEWSDFSAAAGGSVNISAASFVGTNTISAKGGRGLSNGAGAGGGRIALKAGSGDSTQFNTLAITAVGGGTGAGGYLDPAAGTVYLEAGSLGSGTGTVWINNGGAPSPSYTYTPIPPFTNAVLNELSQALVAVTNYGKVFATTNTTVGNLVIYPNCTWTLTNFTVTVISSEHYLGDLSIRGQGQTNRVDYYNQIIWAPKLNGTVISFF